MFKKLFMLAVIVAVGGVVVFGTHAVSHLKQAVGWAKATVEESLPIDYELQRAERLVDDVIPEIRTCRKTVAEEEVEIAYLQNDIQGLETRQSRAEDKLRIENSALKEGQKSYVFAGVRYTRSALESDLGRAFEQYKSDASLLESKRRLLDARGKSLLAAKAKLQKVVDEKARLETLVQNLYAQLRQTEAMQSATNLYSIDDSNLSKAGRILVQCKKRLDVAQKMIEGQNHDAAGIELETLRTKPITEEIDGFFSARTAPDPAPEAPVAASAR